MVLWDTLAAAGSKLVVLFLVIFFITTGFAIQGSLLFADPKGTRPHQVPER
jgi:hypothetical protein